jgi:hypothetical protein
MYRRDEAMLRLQEGGLDDGRTQANEQRPQQRYGGPVAAQVPRHWKSSWRTPRAPTAPYRSNTASSAWTIGTALTDCGSRTPG